MSHRLEPRPGAPELEPREVARRLREEFASCVVDAEQGKDDAGDVLAKLIELGAPQAIIDDAAAYRDRALRITVADSDDDDIYLSFLLRESGGAVIGYESAQHEERVRPLLERCAKALGYRIELI